MGTISVGAAEGCDLLILFFKGKVKDRSLRQLLHGCHWFVDVIAVDVAVSPRCQRYCPSAYWSRPGSRGPPDSVAACSPAHSAPPDFSAPPLRLPGCCPSAGSGNRNSAPCTRRPSPRHSPSGCFGISARQRRQQQPAKAESPQCVHARLLAGPKGPRYGLSLVQALRKSRDGFFAPSVTPDS